MINNFAYTKAGSISEAVKELSKEGARLHAGGTDLLGCLRDGIFQAETVVSISGLEKMKQIGILSASQKVSIGALSTLADIAADPMINNSYMALYFIPTFITYYMKVWDVFVTFMSQR